MNTNYNFERIDTEPNIRPYQRTASTAFSIGNAVAWASGQLVPATAITTAANTIGIVQEAVASTDANYASAVDVSVDVARKGDNGDWFYAVVGTGSATQTNVGNTYDLNSSGQVNLNASSVNVVKVQRVISASIVVVTFV